MSILSNSTETEFTGRNRILEFSDKMHIIKRISPKSLRIIEIINDI